MTEPLWSPALLVPIQVEALPISQAAYNGAPWSWSTANYPALGLLDPVDAQPFTDQGPAIPGSDIFTGVVLHWALPDGLSQGAQAGTGVTYPAIPNRWLVVRRAPAGSSWSTAAWMVASDYLNGELGSPWPNQLGTGGATLGMSWPIAAWPGEATVSQNAVQPALTAVGAGDASWSAFTPNVVNVLALADPLTDQAGQPITGPVSYTVAGWYSDPAADPLLGVAGYGPDGWQTQDEWQQILDGLSWSAGNDQELAEAAQAAQSWAAGHGVSTDPTSPRGRYPSRLICAGSVLGVDWQGPTGPYVSGAPTTNSSWPTYQQPRIALANAGLDAFGAMLGQAELDAGMPAKDVQQLVEILQAFLHEEVALLDQPDGLVELALDIQQDWFEHASGGTSWDVVAPRSTDSPSDSPSPVLDDDQAGWLTALNQAQHALDATTRSLAYAQWQCYALWWKGKRLDSWLPPPPQQEQWQQLIDAATPAMQAEVAAAANAYRWLRRQRDEALVRLQLGLGDLQLVAGTRPQFHRPSLPVLLINGAGRGYKHGPDGRFSPFGTLACRFTGQTVAGIAVPVGGGEQVVGASDFPAPSLPDAGQPAEIADLLVESFFLDQLCAPVIAQSAAGKAGSTDPWALLAAIRTEQTLIWNPSLHPEVDEQTLAEATGLQFAYGLGALPSKVAVALWSVPWSPLYLDWAFNYFPGTPQQAAALQPWQLPLGPGGGAPLDDYSYQWTAGTPSQQNPLGLQGRTFLTPQTSDVLAARLEKVLTDYAENPKAGGDLWAIRDALAYLGQADLLSQALTGFDQVLLQHDPSTFPLPHDGSLDAFLNPSGAPAANPDSTPDPTDGTLTPSPFNPIRAGHLKLTRLWVVDAFGQVLRILDPDGGSLPITTAPILDADLVTATDPQLAELKPRLSQFCRLDLDLLSAVDDTRVLGVQTGVNPICGWVIPNHLDRSLLVYEADGALAGELLLAADRALWSPAPQTSPPPLGPAPVVIDNAHLSRIVTGVLDAPDSHATLAGLLSLIDTAFWAINPSGGWSDEELPVLVGRPLAVVRAGLRLSLQGGPAYRQDWPVTGEQQTDGYDQVRFDVQLGASELLDDGLVGFYLNDDYRQIDTAYSITDPPAYVSSERPAVSAGDPAGVLLTLLMDPQSTVHAITGMLPALTRTLPGSLSTPALNRMAVTFRTGPVLDDPATVAMPLPALRQGGWSWLQYLNPTDKAAERPVLAANATAALPDPAPVLREGWLKLVLDGPPTKLTYAVTPSTVTTTSDPANPATALVRLTAYNGTGAEVDLQQIVFTVPVGAGAGDLSPDVSAVVAGPVGGTGWQLSGDGTGAFTATPTGSGAVAAGATLTFQLAGVPVAAVPGTVGIGVLETTDSARPAQVYLAKVPPRPPTMLTYTATPTSVATGAAASVTVTAFNSSSAAVYPARLVLAVPLGASATDLAAAPGAVTVTPPAGWTVTGDGQGNYAMLPAGATALAPGTGLALTVALATVAAPAGPVLLGLGETASRQPGSSPLPDTTTTSLLLTKTSVGANTTQSGALTP
jgi:hypothetical protein